jgi:hypothetical protein
MKNINIALLQGIGLNVASLVLTVFDTDWLTNSTEQSPSWEANAS